MYRIIISIARRSICKNNRMFHVMQNTVKRDVVKYNSCASTVLAKNDPYMYTVKRFKSKKKKAKQEQQQEEEEESEEEIEDDRDIDDLKSPGSVVANIKVLSLRLDSILKTAVRVTRLKIDEAFYTGRIRLNGCKVSKKSEEVNLDDEIDFIHGVSIDNPNFLKITRVKLLKFQPIGGGIKVTACIDRNMLIENYEDPYKPVVSLSSAPEPEKKN